MNIRARSGFTLIELLTVVAIIAVLISIILPTAGKARDAAHRSACGRNLHFVGVALMHYAAANDGYLPPVGSIETQRSRNYFVCEGPEVEAWTALAAGDRLQDPGILFCPAMSSPSFQHDTPANPWPGSPGRTCYSRRWIPPPGGGGLAKVDCVSGNTAVVADLIVSPTHVAYQHGEGINVLYFDGGVEFRRDILDLFADAGVTGSTAGNAAIDAVWARLDR